MSDLSKRIADLSTEARTRLEHRLLRQAAAGALEQSFPRRLPTEPAPVSYSQHRMWFLHQLRPDSALYNVTSVHRLKGHLNVKTLQSAFDALFDRHEVFRTYFLDVSGTPSQVVAPHRSYELPVMDLTHRPGSEREPEALRLLSAAVRRPFDLSRDLMLRAEVMRLSPQDHFLLVQAHHIAFDEWSMGILFRELEALYHGFSQGGPPVLPELPVRYADFAIWQNSRLQGELLQTQLSYWKKRLEGIPPALELPTDRPRPAVPSYRGAARSFRFPRALLDSLVALCLRESSTPFMALLAAWDVLLYRYTGQEDIVVGSPIALRSRTEFEGLIGCFLNTLALRTDLSGQPTFRELLARVREVCLEAHVHKDLPFERLVEELHPQRDRSRSPLFQVMFAHQNAANAQLRLPGLEVTSVEVDSGTAKFELTLFLTEGAEGLQGTIEYSMDLFEAETITRMIGHFRTLLEGIVADPDQPIGLLPILTRAERHQILVEWNTTEVEYPKDSCIHGLFEKQAALSPEAVAVTYEEQDLAYRELNMQANQVAHYLERCGVGPDKVVGICMERSLDMVIGILGILKAGGAYLPLNPAYPQARLKFMLDDAASGVLLTQASLVDRLPADGRHVLCLDRDWAVVRKESDSNPAAGVSATNLAYVSYTSGSTGCPKGVAVPHRAVTRLLFGVRYAHLGPQHSFLQLSEVSFDASTFELWGPLLHGGRCVLFPGRVPTADALARQIGAYGIDTLWLTASLFNAIVEENPEALAGIRQLLIGGETLSVQHVREGQKRLPGTTIINGYGPTEATTFSCCYRIPANLDEAAVSIPIGQPIANTTAYVLDANLQPVPIGVPGELFIGGDGLARGYVNQPALTGRMFVSNPFSSNPNARLYRSGDRVRLLGDGNLDFLGRSDEQVKIRGFRVETAEIEATLARHPSVKTAVVVAREDRPGDRRLAAYYIARIPEPIPPGTLRTYLLGLLPDFMVPSWFVHLQEFPLTTGGKIDRQALPLPESQLRGQGAGYAAPNTPTQEILAAMWAELLHLERVGIHDNFFDLGGHSLLATRVVSRVRQVFGKDLGLRAMFENPTIAGLAVVIDPKSPQGKGSAVPPLTAISRDAPLPQSFAQQRLWFLDQIEPGAATYNIPYLISLRGVLNRAALAGAIKLIAARQESLRTTFGEDAGRPVQHIAAAAGIELWFEDLADLPEETRRGEAKRKAEDEARLPFELKQGPLARLKLYRLGDQEHLLLVNMHHIISDEWSMEVFFNELGSAYGALAQGEEPQFPKLPAQYGDYAVWQREALEGAVLETPLEFWKTHLAGVLPVLNLPTDRPRPTLPSRRGGVARVTFPRELLASLRRLAQDEEATLFMTLFAAFNVLLFRYTGQVDILVGTPTAGRSRVEVESLIGFFVNTLAVRTDLSGNPSFRQLLARVRKTCLAVYGHQEVPFEKVVEALRPTRDRSHSPFFQVIFALGADPDRYAQLPGLDAASVEIDSGTAKFDVSLSVLEKAGRLSAAFEYSTDLFDGSTIERMAEHLQTLLEGIVRDPDRKIGLLDLMTAEEQQKVLVEWNRTATDYPREATIHGLFETEVERTPDSVAVVSQDQTMTYRQLNVRANRLAHFLCKRGIGAENLVGICMERSPEMIVALLGILKAGGAYVPLDPDFPQERLRFMVEDAGISVILSGTSQAARLPKSSVEVILLDRLEDPVIREQASNPCVCVRAENLAYINYTSGSTGKPKGVSVPHRAVVRLLKGVQYARLDASKTFLQHSSISFDASTFEIWAPLLHGARCVLLPDGIPTAEGLGKAIRTHGIDTLWLTSSLFNALVDERPEALDGIRQLLIGGEALSLKHVKRALSRLPNTEIVNGYGPTEATTFTCCYPIPRKFSDSVTSIPIGRPIGNTEVYVLDENQQPVPVGVPGELHVGGAGLARGYLHLPELTAEKFIAHPFSPEAGARLYRTGDLARWLADGNLEFLGRTDDQVKIRGHRIEPGEIESVLSTHPMVRKVAVVAREGRPGEKQLVAYVVPDKENVLSPDSLRNFALQKMPRYLVPQVFMMLNDLPLAANGKVDRHALPAPDLRHAVEEAARVPPRTPTDERLARLWMEVLQLDRVGIRDDFFDLGGHSLLAVRLFAKIENEFGKRLPLSTLFQAGTVERLARIIDGERCPEPTAPVVVIQQGTSGRPLFFVHAMSGEHFSNRTLIRHLGAERPIYGLRLPQEDGAVVGLPDLQATARLHVESMCTVQPKGPYYLAGYSYGGKMALEIAQQLVAKGERVALLAMIEAGPSVQAKRTAGELRRASFYFLRNFVFWIVDDLGKTTPADIFDRARRKGRIVARRIVRLLKTGRYPTGELALDDIFERRDVPEQIRRVERLNYKAWQEYVCLPYAGRVTLFRARASPLFHSFEPDLGWSRIASGGVEIKTIGGNHKSILSEPYVRCLADQLRASLNEADRALP